MENVDMVRANALPPAGDRSPRKPPPRRNREKAAATPAPPPPPPEPKPRLKEPGTGRLLDLWT